jgi:hypothetical protein
MKKYFFFFLVFFLFCGTLWAQTFDLYIYNKPFHAPIISEKGILYVPLKDLAKALGFNVETNGDAFVVGTKPQRIPKGKIILNGKPFQGEFFQKNGEIFVPLKSFVEASGNKLVYNKETQMIDIVPGNSPLSQSIAQSLEKDMLIGSSTPSGSLPPPAGSSSPQGASQSPISNPLSASGINLPNQLEALKEKYAQKLSESADVLQYFASLQAWGNHAQDNNNQFGLELLEIERMPDQREAFIQFANLLDKMSAAVSQEQQSFNTIVPPPQFQNSHAILRQVVEAESQFIPLAQQASHLLRAASTANPNQILSIANRMRVLLKQLHALEASESQYEINYLRALQVDLENLK